MYTSNNDDNKCWRIEVREPTAHLSIPLKERIQMAREHMKIHGDSGLSLWPYQRFAMSIHELLDAAERGTNV